MHTSNNLEIVSKQVQLQAEKMSGDSPVLLFKSL